MQYSIGASSDQLGRAQSILPIDKDIDAIYFYEAMRIYICNLVLHRNEMDRWISVSFSEKWFNIKLEVILIALPRGTSKSEGWDAVVTIKNALHWPHYLL